MMGRPSPCCFTLIASLAWCWRMTASTPSGISRATSLEPPRSGSPWHLLYFLPLPQKQRSLRRYFVIKPRYGDSGRPQESAPQQATPTARRRRAVYTAERSDRRSAVISRNCGALPRSEVSTYQTRSRYPGSPSGHACCSVLDHGRARARLSLCDQPRNPPTRIGRRAPVPRCDGAGSSAYWRGHRGSSERRASEPTA